MGYRVGIDVGGTFTDLVMVRPDGTVVIDKTPTTLANQGDGVLVGLGQLAGGEGLSLGDFLGKTEAIVHGTTTADNTMIEMGGAVTGLLTSEGHRDEIELRRGFKEDIWNPALPPPEPICRRRQRIGVPERLDFEGAVLVPLDEESVRRACRRFARLGVESVAVVFLFSFVNPTHERRAAEIIAEELPDVHVSLSHEVMPSAPEFERTSTTLVNAYVGPKIGRYLNGLGARLAESGYGRSLLIMQSNGGIMTTARVTQRAVAVLGSGPAGGVTGACEVARAAGITDFISVDMGGTSYDVCLVRGGAPEITSGWSWRHRYLLGLPMVDVHSVGAGGGSIARVDAGMLQVGPQSAGSEPGPICYGRGGIEPTVTDANLLLGYLNPEGFCGGSMRLEIEGVARAIEERIGRPLGMPAVGAAAGIIRLVNANMANAVRKVSAHRGVDPRDLVLVVFGGNGPVHGCMQADELDIERIFVPKLAPTFSALGLLLADHVVDEMRAYITPMSLVDPARVDALFVEMESAASAALEPGAFGSRQVEHERFAHLCYPGQTFDIPVPLPAHRGAITAKLLEATVARFHDLHEALHTYAAREEVPILRGLRVKGIRRIARPRLPSVPRGRAASVRTGARKVYFGERFVATPVFDGARIGAGASVPGPAIIEEAFTTIVVHPGHHAVVDEYGNYHVRRLGRAKRA
jgi:N-methylhydantoinase A